MKFFDHFRHFISPFTTANINDYVGFGIGNEWVVGYGLDFGEQDRTLPYIGTVTPTDR